MRVDVLKRILGQADKRRVDDGHDISLDGDDQVDDGSRDQSDLWYYISISSVSMVGEFIWIRYLRVFPSNSDGTLHEFCLPSAFTGGI